MKSIQQYVSVLFCTAILLFIAVYGANKTDIALPHFLIQSPDGSELKEVSIFDANDGNYYVFLPAYADMKRVSVSLSSDQCFSLNDIILSDGMNCAGFEFEIPYAFSVNEQETATFRFYKSENVAAMFIETDSGSMEYIHDDINYEEYSSITLYTSNGKVDYSDNQCTLKGRGNSSWGYDKRPYTFRLAEAGDLMGMGAATDWILLANASDETNLNNKLIFDLASRVGFPWVPESRWVDLYLNGEYNGLYLLTEKVEVNEERLNIDADSGDFLCKIDLNERWTTLRNPFLSESGRTVEISYPENLTKTQAAEIESLTNQMEQALLSEDDLRVSAIIDLDSWARRYLIDEVSGNIDSDIASCFFYFSDGKFFAGPVWDFDMALGNCTRNQEPCSFIAKNVQAPEAVLSPYYRALYANESFYNRMTEIYCTEFVPVLQQIIDEEIDLLSASISKASQINSLRWRSMFDVVQSWYPYTVHTAAGIKDYLSRRVAFLNSAWIENEDYCTIQFRPAHTSSSWNISVKKGTCLNTTYIDTVSTVWIDSATGQKFDFSQPVMTDMILFRQSEDGAYSHDSIGTGDYITFLSIAVLLIMLIGFVAIDSACRKKERRGADER